MTIDKIDFYFPFFVLAYGFIMCMVLYSPLVSGGLQERLKESGFELPRALYVQIKSHRVLGLICLIVGALWSLQNLWLR